MKGIKETTDLFDLVKAAVEAVRIAKADGKIDLADAPLLLTPATKLPAAIMGAKEIPSELADLDLNEITELSTRFGDIVRDERYQRAFAGLVVFADAVYEIASKEDVEA